MAETMDGEMGWGEYSVALFLACAPNGAAAEPIIGCGSPRSLGPHTVLAPVRADRSVLDGVERKGAKPAMADC